MTPEQFVSALRARGVTLSVKTGRLRLDPGVAWKALTPDEVHCLKNHRTDIKRLADGSEPAPEVEPEPGAAPAEPTPEPVVWKADYSRRIVRQDLRDMGITGTNRAAYERCRKWLAEKAQHERSKRDTATMFESLRRHQRGTHGGYRE